MREGAEDLEVFLRALIQLISSSFWVDFTNFMFFFPFSSTCLDSERVFILLWCSFRFWRFLSASFFVAVLSELLLTFSC